MDPAIEDDAAVDGEPVTALELRRPDVPVTLTDLAARKGEAIEIIEARVTVLETLRKAALRCTHPEDWLLFKAPAEHGGQVVGYLQDCGCDRVRDLYGIRVFDVSKPEKLTTNDPAVFHYVITGCGRSAFTLQTVEGIEGGRSSTDDVCRDVKGLALDLLVRKSARANLDGNITRELAGLKAVPLDEIKAAWEHTTKTVERCRLGRGFGTARERLGATRAEEPTVTPPKCGVCGTVAKWRPANDKGPAFYGCPKYKEHEDRKWSITEEKWRAQQPAAPTPDDVATPNSQSPNPKAPPVTQSDIPWGGR